MTAWRLISACGCIKLRTSSFIIANINMGLSVIFSIFMLGVAGGSMIANNSAKEEERRMAQELTVQFTIRQLHFLRMIVFSIVLLVGLYEIKRYLVRVYLITAAIFLFLDFNMFLVSSVHEYSAGTVVLWVTILGVEAFCILVVRSYYYYEMEPTLITA